MRIIVPIKQVPETSSVRMDPETGTIVREGSEAVVNPLDLYAIEAALRMKEEHGGRVDVVSMGPRRAEIAIREAIAMGCDDGYLVSDKKFGGADTWATSYVLAQVIRGMGAFHLIVAGERATDGDTGQVGPGIASWLDLPCATYVAHAHYRAADEPGGSGVLEADRLIEEGYQRLEVRLPALITVVKEIATPRLPTLAGKKRAMRADVTLVDRDGVDVEPSYIGLKGSPTKVVRIRTPKVTRGGRLVDAREGVEQAVSELVAFLRDRDLVGGSER
ncbi:MAG: electron transfer flavoprotein subunit beta/FixA family protein [Spirochaetota bacterium]